MAVMVSAGYSTLSKELYIMWTGRRPAQSKLR